jgi:maltooligosyltrehalose trehalohydrolase
MSQSRRLPIGAEILPSGGVHFRVWAPRRRRVEVVLEGGGASPRREPAAVALEPEGGGYFSGRASAAGAGSLYRFRLDGEPALYPDPAARFQPEGVHGPSQVIDPGAFRWTDGGWRGVRLRGQVLYEMHVGTFTRAGTWEAAARELPELAALGVTVLEVMPVAEFPGRFGWGYDGVDLFAPTRLYGTPDDFRRFVDRAHAAGLGVILDVVYNHFGPDGNYLKQYAADYFTDRYENEWGEAINFDGPNAGPVREFFAANAAYWVDEFHLDGLRLDATQQIFDSSPDNILAVLARRVRAAARGRATLLVAENEPQETRLVRPPEQGGYGLDCLWNDDFHHSATVALTGHNEAYYTDYLGRPQEFVSAAKWGYLYQGQRYQWQKKRRGTPALDLGPAHFVTFTQNHDQVANSGRGQRCHELTSPGRFRALTALLLLGPGTPMLFQGQEFAASGPFLYFADHKPDLAKLVCKGRAEFLAQFRSLAAPEVQDCLPRPDEAATFERCKLDFAERERHKPLYDLHRDLLRLRREEPAFRAQRPRGLDGAVLGDAAFVLRYFAEDGRDRLLLVNLGRDLRLDPAPEPLLAPPAGAAWDILWSSEDPRYGGNGTAPLDTEANWIIPGEAAVVLQPTAGEPGASAPGGA